MKEMAEQLMIPLFKAKYTLEFLKLEERKQVEEARLTPQERAEAFALRYPKFPPFIIFKNRLYGLWIIGTISRQAPPYYGAYPHTLKERILALFPDCKVIMHLFSGSIQDFGTITYDINPKYEPTICDDVRNIRRYKAIISKVDLVIADPPYEEKDFRKYGLKPFNKTQVIRDLGAMMKRLSYLVWLDLIVPMYSGKTWNLLGHIAVVVGVKTRVRLLTLLEHV